MTAGVRYIGMFLQTLKQPHQSHLQHASRTMPVHYPITRSLWHPCMGSTLLPQITSKRLLRRSVPPVVSNCSTRLAGQSQTHWNNPRAVARVVRKLCDSFGQHRHGGDIDVEYGRDDTLLPVPLRNPHGGEMSYAKRTDTRTSRQALMEHWTYRSRRTRQDISSAIFGVPPHLDSSSTIRPS